MNYYGQLAVFLLVYMTVWFVISLILKRNDLADIAWGLGFVLLSWVSFFSSATMNLRSIIVCLLVTLWGVRLSLHIYTRNKRKKEDFRYLEWRKQWGRWFYFRSYFQIFILQGLLLYIIVFPVLVINRHSISNFNLLDLLGIFIWLIGFVFESVGDYQLSQFISNSANQGKIIQTGLWQYSRHPNYFGEVTQWWGIYVIALSLNNGWLTFLSPLTITLLILFVSGIPLLEKKYQGRADFEEYKKRTSIFLPLPPKKNL